MLRIKSDALTLKDNKYWYQEQPFDGFAYMVADSTIHAVRMIDGESAGSYASPIFPERGFVSRYRHYRLYRG